MIDSESEREHDIRTEAYNDKVNEEFSDILSQYPDMPKEIGTGPHQLGLKAAVLDEANQGRITAATLRNPITIAICRHKSGPQTEDQRFSAKEQTALAEEFKNKPVMYPTHLNELIVKNQIVIRTPPYLPAELIQLFTKFDQLVAIRVELKKSVWFDTARRIGTPIHD